MAETNPQILSATTEEEAPPNRSSPVPVEKMSQRKVDDWERHMKEEEDKNRWKLKNRSFILLVICIVAVSAIYLVDSFWATPRGQASETTTQILDIFKSIIPLLIGYLFATEAKSK